jgi:hypothetical protein
LFQKDDYIGMDSTLLTVLVWACIVWTIMTLPLSIVLAFFAVIASRSNKRHIESTRQLLCEQQTEK